MRHTAPAFVVTVLLVACGAPSDAPLEPLAGPGASVVFGAPHAPTGGQIVVGMLVATPPSERLVDLVDPEALAAFYEQEALNGPNDDGNEPSGEGVIEDVEEGEPEIWEPWAYHDGQSSQRDKVVKAVAKQTGVRVVFCDLCADEIRDEVLVVVEDRDLYESEVDDLERYLSRGGRVLRDTDLTTEIGRPCPGVLKSERVLANAVIDAIRTSIFVRRFSVDPLELQAAEREGDEVRVRLRTRPATAGLENLAGQHVADVHLALDGELAFECPDPALDPLTHRLVATWMDEAGDVTLRRAWRIVDLVGTAERRVFASRTLEAGTTYAPRVLFLNSRTCAPVAGCEATVSLVRGDEVLATATGTSNAEGSVDAVLSIPASLTPGSAHLVVGTDRFPVDVRHGTRLSLVTDRGVYRRTDEIHARAMVHDAARGRPVPDAEVIFTFHGEEKRVSTSAHGIAATTFAFENTRVGPSAVAARVGEVRALSRVSVRAFETPAFTVALEASELALRAGETAPVRLVARYLNGAPLADARVWASRPNYFRIGAAGVTDEDGRFGFSVTATKNAQYGRLGVFVQDAAGRTVEQVVTIRVRRSDEKERKVAKAPPMPDPRPEWVWVQPRAQVLTVGDVLELDIQGPDGPAWIDIGRKGVVLRGLSARITEGRAHLSLPLDEDLAGPLQIRGWQLRGKKLVGGSATVLVVRGRSLEVTAEVQRERYAPGETAQLDVAVTRADGTPAAAVLGYWGVDEGVLEIAPMPDGREEVFDVLPAHAKSDLASLAQDAEDGRTVAAARAAKILRHPHQTDNLGGLYRVRHRRLPHRERTYREAVREGARSALQAARAAYVDACTRVPLAEFRTARELREVLLLLARGQYLDPDALLDPWGTPFKIGQGQGRWAEPMSERSWWIRYGTPVAMAGPDLRFGTADDVYLVWMLHTLDEFPGRLGRFLALVEEEATEESALLDAPFWGPAENGIIGLGGGAGGAFAGRGGSRDLGRGGGGRTGNAGPTRVRKDFAPTLCFVPEAIVGPEGRTTLEIPLKDALTTWRMRLVASAADGATGVGNAAIRVSQPLHADPWIAPHLTVGDELDLPVALRDETEDAMDVALKLVLSDELACVGEPIGVVHVKPGRTAVHTFRLRAHAPGVARIRVEAEDVDYADVIERVVHVWPNGREDVAVANATLSAVMPRTLTLPPLAPGATGASHELRVYPSPLSETVAGFEGLIRKPHGCFEQTSSTVYPMVMALAYMRRTKQIDRELEQRAREFLEAGRARLLGYEVKGVSGGFSLWGKKPASLFLSAYALHEFTDLRRVRFGDSDLLARIAIFLRVRQEDDGSWRPPARGTAHGDDAALRQSYPLTAYVAWGLARAKLPSEGALDWLAEHRGQIDDPYAIALTALAFQATGRHDTIARELVDRLADLKTVDARGVLWQPPGATLVRGRGHSATVETTALVAQALVADGRHPDLATQALARLVGARDRSGRFGTTQSTVLALMALLAADAGPTRTEAARVAVARGPEAALTLTLPPGSTRPATLALPTPDAPLETSFEGVGRVRVAFERTAWVKWEDSLPVAGRLAFEVDYPEGELPVGEVAIARVTVQNRANARAATVTLEVGLPPGCTARAKDVKGAGAESVERAERAMVIYLGDLESGQERTFEIPFTPRYRLDVLTAPSQAYEYYTPEEAALIPPHRVRTAP